LSALKSLSAAQSNLRIVQGVSGVYAQDILIYIYQEQRSYVAAKNTVIKLMQHI
jgi:hypothetical protein